MQGHILIAASDPIICRAVESLVPSNWAAEYSDSFSSAAALPNLDEYALLLLALRPQETDAFSLLRSLSRRIGAQTITAGPFTYDTATLRLYKDGHEIPLSAKENAMIKLFLDNPDRVFSRENLYDLIWGSRDVDDNTAAVYVSRLRQKIEDIPREPRYLQTVRGIGYRFMI